MATCPYCTQPIEEFAIERRERSDLLRTRDLRFLCPHCHTVIGTGVVRLGAGTVLGIQAADRG